MRIGRDTFERVVSMLRARTAEDEVEAVYAPGPDSPAGGDRLTRDVIVRLLRYLADPDSGYERLGSDTVTTTVDIAFGDVRITIPTPQTSPYRKHIPSRRIPLVPSASTSASPDAAPVVMRKQWLQPSVQVPDYRLRVNMKKETVFPRGSPGEAEALTHPAISGNSRPNEKRTYRLKRRYSFKSSDGGGGVGEVVFPVRIDVTAVRQLTQSRAGVAAPTYAELMMQDETYEVEVEALRGGTPPPPGRKDDSSDDAMARLGASAVLTHFAVLLKLIDDTHVLLSVSDRSAVLKQYSDLAHTSRFIGPKPATLELVHLACSPVAPGVPCVRRDYTVTDKADGERRLLFIAADRRVFTINDRMFVRDTGLVAAAKPASILDGEHVDGAFMAFDAYFVDGKDVRQLPLMLPPQDSPSQLATNINTAATDKNAKRRSASARGHSEITSRLAAAEAVAASIRRTEGAEGADEEADGEEGDGSPSPYAVTVKTFKYVADTQGLADACRHFLYAPKDGASRYGVDGLIFTPAMAPAKPGGGSWPEVLKWKPPEQNTIDFQVKLRSADELAVLEDGTVCRTAELLVSQNEWLATQLTAMDVLSGSAMERLNRLYPPVPGGNRGRPVPPPMRATPFIVPYLDDQQQQQQQQQQQPSHLVYLPKDANLLCANGDEIHNGAVVEFAYDAAAKHLPHEARWRALKVRRDKTEEHLRTGRVTANAMMTALSVWRSIMAPISERALQDPAALAELLDQHQQRNELQDRYYVSNARSSEADGGMAAMRRFHSHFVKGVSLLHRFTAASGLGRSVFDFGCGRAGDLGKWIEMGATRVMGIDKYASNLYDPDLDAGKAYARLLRMQQQRGHSLRGMRVAFLPMDASCPIADAAYAQSLDATNGDREVARVLWGHKPCHEVRTAALRQWCGFASGLFDLATCMFAIHYMFGRAEDLAQFAANVAGVLRPGGHFVGCCLDGGLVDGLLAREAPQVGDSIAGAGDRPCWRITRRYHHQSDGAGPTPAAVFGRRIDVYMESIGQELPEFLVDYSVLADAMERVGLVPMAPDDAQSVLGVRHSTGTFDALYADMIERRGARSGGVRDYDMTDDEKRYSFLNRWFVFRKKSSL